MREISIEIPRQASNERILRVVDEIINGSGLRIVSRGSLKTYPGCTHWHLKNGSQRGTLKLTWWPPERRLWFKIQAGREANWMDDVALQLKDVVLSVLAKDLA
jgi:hypothetical protein